MKYRILATDYDGTIAFEGRVDDPTLEALHRARAYGLRLVMVTGRELADLFNVFPHPELFERIVAENGAVLYSPADRTVKPLAASPPPSLLELLALKSVPISVGHSIVATVEPYEHQVLAAIRDLGLEWHVIFNEGSVMALPSDVTKATGLAVALAELSMTVEQTVGVGDAENDQAFLRSCGLAVAVENALPAVKAMADLVTAAPRGAGVAELIDCILSGAGDVIAPNVARSHPTPQ
jgi:hydroxymethylpyrimidine pyrophosphatase-like HAD family hydrolase